MFVDYHLHFLLRFPLYLISIVNVTLKKVVLCNLSFQSILYHFTAPLLYIKTLSPRSNIFWVMILEKLLKKKEKVHLIQKTRTLAV